MKSKILSEHLEGNQITMVRDIGNGHVLLEYWYDSIGALKEEWNTIVLTKLEVEGLAKFVQEIERG